jgi:hypothetical protein
MFYGSNLHKLRGGDFDLEDGDCADGGDSEDVNVDVLLHLGGVRGDDDFDFLSTTVVGQEDMPSQDEEENVCLRVASKKSRKIVA